ncbi:hypothetical protein [Paenibacillus sp. UASWS1643]|uniref:hypothetical protein n=1 Tax=Paenibacillus sp. UASWS1643 TaxID=2580422 RepID=UPI00123BF1D3|nr:hypothetical protein [Paenibacillus sp. UASWS1643]KAA8750113.1 hypothetical protein FE296_16070 [Paenibacillus sp. UASWS1643]
MEVIRADITVGEAFENLRQSMRELEKALLVALQPLVDYYDVELERLRRMAAGILEMKEEYMEYISTPEVPSFALETPYFKAKFNMPKRTYFPKVRATARSTC